MAEQKRAPIRRGRPERALAWLVTGPLGHLCGALAEIAVLWARFGARRLSALARRG